MRILQIGPSVTKMPGGMAAVIRGINEDKDLLRDYEISSYASCVSGSLLTRLVYSVFAYLVFLFKIKNYDLFHVHAASKGSTFRKSLYVHAIHKAGKKVLLHVHSGAYLSFYDSLGGLKKKMADRLWAESDEVIVLSEEWRSAFLSRFPTAKISAIENGVDTDALKEGASNLRETNGRLLFLNRVIKEKGVYELVDAVRTAANKGYALKLFLAGVGSELNSLREYVRRMGQDGMVEFCGWVDGDDKIKLLSRCSTVVLPSYSEAMPLGILEGMAAGKLIIATRVGSIPELIRGEQNGLLVEPKRSEELSEAIIRAVALIAEGSFTGEENEKIIEDRFSLHRMHGLIAEIYQRLQEFS